MYECKVRLEQKILKKGKETLKKKNSVNCAGILLTRSVLKTRRGKATL